MLINNCIMLKDCSVFQLRTINRQSGTSVGESLGFSGVFCVISFDSSSHKAPEEARAAKRARQPINAPCWNVLWQQQCNSRDMSPGTAVRIWVFTWTLSPHTVKKVVADFILFAVQLSRVQKQKGWATEVQANTKDWAVGKKSSFSSRKYHTMKPAATLCYAAD